ncbi:MAG: CDP-glucose 4,6-dehydratase [Spirochaetes bacterium]|nr:CDP-glucose 4,6-dehydratase [Spirochaetota bacterium]
MNCFQNFYSKKKVFITGDTGFKGSWLSLMLKELNANVTGYSLEPPTVPCLFDILKLKDKIKHIAGDVRDKEKLLHSIKETEPDIIFHLAAQSLVRRSYSEPVLTYETNLLGTLNILELSRLVKSVRAVVIITSDKCYENKEWIFAYRENDALGGYDPYSSSKACAELISAAYRKSFFNTDDYGKSHKTAIATVRAGNIIGGGDWTEDRLVPDIIRSLVEDKEVLIRNPDSIRPWQHVLEPITGYLYLASLMYKDGKIFSDAFNFGPNSNDILTVEDVVKKAIKAWGKGSYKIKKVDNLHEAKFLRLDTGRSQFFLNWKPVYNVDQAIDKTIRWYKEYYQNKNADIYNFTVSQMHDYIKSAEKSYLEWIK